MSLIYRFDFRLSSSFIGTSFIQFFFSLLVSISTRFTFSTFLYCLFLALATMTAQAVHVFFSAHEVDERLIIVPSDASTDPPIVGSMRLAGRQNAADKKSYSSLLCERLSERLDNHPRLSICEPLRQYKDKVRGYVLCLHKKKSPVEYLYSDLSPNKELRFVCVYKCEACILRHDEATAAVPAPAPTAAVPAPAPTAAVPAPAPSSEGSMILQPINGDNVVTPVFRSLGAALALTLQQHYHRSSACPNPQVALTQNWQLLQTDINKTLLKELREGGILLESSEEEEEVEDGHNVENTEPRTSPERESPPPKRTRSVREVLMSAVGNRSINLANQSNKRGGRGRGGKRGQ
jgi:hypothetical protein